MPSRITFHAVVAAALAALLPGLLRAEVITPDSVPGLPITSPVVDKGAIAPGAAIGAQFTPFGIELGPVAVVRLGGTLAWAATNDFWLTQAGTQLNFGDGTIWAAFGIPGTDTTASTTSVSVEFLGVPSGQGWITGFDSQGAPVAFDINGAAGAHGGTVASIDSPDIAAFTVEKFILENDPTAGQPWGVAEVRFGALTPAAVPEPGSIPLALAGAVALFAARRRGGCGRVGK